MDFATLKALHQALALISVAGFVLRWAWKWRESGLADHRLTRTLPHVIDTAFLVTGIALAMKLHLSVPDSAWLNAKVGGLVLYVILASLAYKRLKQRRARLFCFIAALATFGWVVSVAISHSPWGFFAALY